MFFATTEYDSENKTYRTINDEKNKTGILYKLLYNISNERINIIGAQALERPTVQRAFSINLLPNENFNNLGSHKKSFKITSELSKKYFDMFDGGKKLMPKDSLTNKIYEIQNKKTILKKAIKIYSVKNKLKFDEIRKIILNNNHTITNKTIQFTKKELKKIKKEWTRFGKINLYSKIKYRY